MNFKRIKIEHTVCYGMGLQEEKEQTTNVYTLTSTARNCLLSQITLKHIKNSAVYTI
jgi:hypothetical protein